MRQDTLQVHTALLRGPSTAVKAEQTCNFCGTMNSVDQNEMHRSQGLLETVESVDRKQEKRQI